MIGIVAALSEDSPFQDTSQDMKSDDVSNISSDSEDLDNVDKSNLNEARKGVEDLRKKWLHPGGDALSRLLAVGGKKPY